MDLNSLISSSHKTYADMLKKYISLIKPGSLIEINYRSILGQLPSMLFGNNQIINAQQFYSIFSGLENTILQKCLLESGNQKNPPICKKYY